jgi:hypothetical protein
MKPISAAQPASQPNNAPTMLSVYSRTTCIGFILRRGKLGYEAFTANERSLGLFKNQNDAAAAVSERAAE